MSGSKLSVFLLIRAFSGGGAQRDAILLANGLAELGIETTLLVLDAEGPLARLPTPDVRIIDLGRGRKLRMLHAVPRLRHCLASNRPAILVASEASGNALAAMAVRLLSPRFRPKLVLREVASPLQARISDPFFQNRLAYRFAPIFYPWADLVLALTEPVRQDLIGHFGVHEHRAVRLGTNAVLPLSREQVLAPSLRTPEPNLLVSVGRLSSEKDFSTLLASLAIVRRSRPAQLVIVGDGPERPSLEAQIAQLGLSESVQLSGYSSDPMATVRRAQLFVSSSRYEGLGNVIVEALSCGVPVVATDAPYGPREVLEDGRWGRLVPVGDPEALAAAVLDTLASNPDGELGKLRAADYTVEAAARKFLDTLGQTGLVTPVHHIG